MEKFIEHLNDFLGVLQNSILQELSESNPRYVEMKETKEKYYEQLKNIVSPDLLDGYVDAQYSLASFELGYCHLCGWRDSKKLRSISPTGTEMLQEFSDFKKYKKLQTQASEKHNALQAEISSDHSVLLNEYINLWEIISGLEKHYCYIGGIYDKKKLDNYFNPANKDTWEKLIELFF